MQDDTNKLVIFDAETRNQLLKGVNILSDAVKVTMGPRGRNVIIEQPGKHPILTKDILLFLQGPSLDCLGWV